MTKMNKFQYILLYTRLPLAFEVFLTSLVIFVEDEVVLVFLGSLTLVLLVSRSFFSILIFLSVLAELADKKPLWKI